MTKREPFHGIPEFYEWLASSNTHYWTSFKSEHSKLSIYVRRVQRLHQPSGIETDIDLANIVAGKPGKGALTKFLDQYEPAHSFYVGNVMHERFRDYLLRRGFIECSPVAGLRQAYPYCLVKAATGTRRLL